MTASSNNAPPGAPVRVLEVLAFLEFGDVGVAGAFDLELDLVLVLQGFQAPHEVVAGARTVVPDA